METKRFRFELKKKSVGFIFNGVNIVEVTALFLVCGADSDELKYLVVKESYLNNKFYNILSRFEFFSFKVAERTFESMVHSSEFDAKMSVNY